MSETIKDQHGNPQLPTCGGSQQRNEIYFDCCLAPAPLDPFGAPRPRAIFFEDLEVLDEQVSSRIAKIIGEARRERVVDVAIDQTNCRAAVGSPTHRTTIHHDCRDGKEANERGKGGLPDDIDIHGGSSRFRGSLFDIGIMTRNRGMACDLRHSKKCRLFMGLDNRLFEHACKSGLEGIVSSFLASAAQAARSPRFAIELLVQEPSIAACNGGLSGHWVKSQK
jgi:hypothetical protein